MVCKKHNLKFGVTPINHINNKIGCPCCADEFIKNSKNIKIKKRKKSLNKEDAKYLEFIKKAKALYSDKYSYIKESFVNYKKPVKIICKKHGEFELTPFAHIHYGHICPICYEQQTFTFDRFKYYCSKNPQGYGIFYIIQCYSDTELFYKVGVTSRSIKERYSNKKTMPYNYNIVQEVTAPSEIVWNLELFIKEYISENYLKYQPINVFPGCYTECYQL